MSNFTQDVKNSCSICNLEFESRNKLFIHLRKSCGISTNSTPLQDTPNTSFAIVSDNVEAFIYVLGGRDRGKTLRSIEKFDIKRRIWEKCAPMLENRGSHGAAVVGTTLYAIGGGGLRSNLCTSECYDYQTNSWKFINSMNSHRHALSVTVLSSRIFVVGGWEHGSRCSSVVECYDTESMSWSFCSPMPTARRLFGLTTFENKLYAFGGHRDDPHWYTSCAETYDPVSIYFLLIISFCRIISYFLSI